MQRISQWFVLGVGVATVGVGVIVASARRVDAAPGPSNVIVTNTPLPVQPVAAAPERVRINIAGGASGWQWFNDTQRTVVLEDVSYYCPGELTAQFGIIGGAIFSPLPLDPSTQGGHELIKVFVRPGETLYAAPVGCQAWFSGYNDP